MSATTELGIGRRAADLERSPAILGGRPAPTLAAACRHSWWSRIRATTASPTLSADAGRRRAASRRTRGEVVDLYALGFRVAMSPDERHAYHGETPLIDEHTREHARLVGRADCLVFVYPTWWSGLPAMLKGWLERVLVPGVGVHVRRQRQGAARPAARPADRRHQHLRLAVDVRQAGQRQRPADAHAGAADQLRTADTPTTWLGLYSIDTTGDNERRAVPRPRRDTRWRRP